jgi:class 3 adenylate cyclase
MVTQESFGSLVRRYRREAELSQEALAERAGLSIRAVRDIELGSKHRPRRDTIQLLLVALEVPEEEQAAFWRTAGQPEGTGPDRPRPHEIPALPAAQVLTVLIADMRGYTAYTVELGDEAGAQLAAQFGASTRGVVEAYGGVVLELRGDEAVCLFVSARQALRASVALEEQYRRHEGEGGLPLGVGIGLDAGEIVPVEGGYRGRALNLAARLCALAEGGDVLVSDGVLHLAGETEGVGWVERARSRSRDYRARWRCFRSAKRAGSHRTCHACSHVSMCSSPTAAQRKRTSRI